jgi:hypothetical protein
MKAILLIINDSALYQNHRGNIRLPSMDSLAPLTLFSLFNTVEYKTGYVEGSLWATTNSNTIIAYDYGAHLRSDNLIAFKLPVLSFIPLSKLVELDSTIEPLLTLFFKVPNFGILGALTEASRSLSPYFYTKVSYVNKRLDVIDRVSGATLSLVASGVDGTIHNLHNQDTLKGDPGALTEYVIQHMRNF